MDNSATFSSPYNLFQEMPKGQEDCPSQVWDIIKKLSVWKDESQEQMSFIMSSHSNIINKGLNDIGKEFSDLQAKITILTKERAVLLNTIENLNKQILNYKQAIHFKYVYC